MARYVTTNTQTVDQMDHPESGITGCDAPTTGSTGSYSVRPPIFDIYAIEVEESSGGTLVVLQICTRVTNSWPLPADTRIAFLSAKLSWTEFKKHPDARGLLGHRCQPSEKLDDCLKDLDGELKAALEQDLKEEPTG